MKADTSVILTINDKKYVLKYDIKALIGLEKLISTKNIAKLMMEIPYSLNDTVMCVYTGLQAEQPSVTEKKAMQLVEKWLEVNPLSELQSLIFLALTRAGAVGSAKNYVEEEKEPGK